MRHELVKLKNNLNTLFVDMPGATSGSVQVWFRAGSALENKEDFGIAHFLEHMFFKGTPTRPGAKIAHDVESFGGEINAFTSFDYTCYYINTPNHKLKTTSDILLDMVSNPMFLEDDITPERGVVFEEYRRSQDNPSQYSFQKIQEACFTGGYSHPILGNEKTITSFSQAQLKRFRKSHYNLKNCMLLVAGDLKEKNKIIKTIEKYKVPQGPASQFPEFRLKKTSQVQVHAKATQLATLSLCIQAPDFEDASAVHEDLALNCLAHGESSRLYLDLVNKDSLANSVGCSTMFMNHGGLHYLRVSFPLEHLEKVLERLESNIVQALKEPFESKEVNKIKNQYLASKIYDKESLESYSFSLGHSYAQTGNIHSDELFVENIRKSSVQDTRKGFESLLSKPHHWNLQVPLDSDVKAIEKKLKNFRDQFSKKTKISKTKEKNPKTKIKTSTFDPQVKLYNLKPGVDLLYRQNLMCPTFVMHTYLKGGITEETQRSNGLYHLLSGLLTRGYKDVDYNQMKEELDYYSASFHAFSGKNAYGLTLHGQSEHFYPLSEHFFGSLISPNIEKKWLDHEKEMVKRALKNQKEDPIKTCFKEVSKLLFNGHPYSFPMIGTEKTISTMTSKKLLEVHRENLEQKNILITYCGDKPFEEIVSFLEDKLQSLSNRKEAKLKKKEILPLVDEHRFISFDREQTQIFHGTPIKGIGSQDSLVMKMITTYLSGQSSELFVEVRDRQGLCYTAQPVHFNALEGAYWGIYMASGHDKVSPALKAIKDLISKICHHGLPKKEFNRIKKMIEGQNLLNVQTNDDYTNIYAVTTFQGLGLDFFHKQNLEVKELEYDVFQKRCKKLLSGKWSSVIVGREDAKA